MSALPAPASGVAGVAGVIAAAIAVGVSGCTGVTSGAPTAVSAPIAAPPPPPPPAPTTGAADNAAPPSPDPTTPGAAGMIPDGDCDSVLAENGLNLRIEDVSASGAADCARAIQLLRDLAARIAEGYPAASGDAVSVSVDNWRCVSGPQTGGVTRCSHEEKTQR